ncbi:MAG: homoserine dehydrogenase [Planctomycetales bacterium]|nr:homoserine dehydrogenase [Planctomycetales bacterium]NIP86295.1 homoserine dehydrogenase [Planctomycetales bacterium]
METTHVAIIGMGTVGTGVAHLLLDQSDRLAQHAGRRVNLKKVVARDLKKPRDVQLPAALLTDDIAQVTDDPEITAVIQLVGGLEPARTIMIQLLESGKDVITANKALLAEHGPELFDRARQLGRSIAFDAAVGGGIPMVTNISQCLSANQILSLHGILNGTCNFVISQMDTAGASYADALQEAQRRGYAEADPTMDVDGSDAAQKLAILVHLAFGARVPWQEIPRQGIDTLQPADLQFARELGYRIKLLAVAQLVEEGLELHVAPQLVRHDSPLAEVRDAYNAIRVVGDAVGRVWFHGLGAGQMPTASAVVADLIDTVVGRAAITFRTLELWSQRPARVMPRDYERVSSRYYLRFDVEDHPGVLAEITGILGRQQISIASVIQHEASESGDEIVSLVVMTHTTTEGGLRKAVSEINVLPAVQAPTMVLRVLD